MIKIIVCGILLFIYVISMTIAMIRAIMKKILELRKNERFKVKCKRCGLEHDVNISDLLKFGMSKNRSITKKEGFVESTNYIEFSKKINCPSCNKRTWTEIYNYNEIKKINTKIMIPFILKYFAGLLVGGICFVMVGLFIFKL